MDLDGGMRRSKEENSFEETPLLSKSQLVVGKKKTTTTLCPPPHQERFRFLCDVCGNELETERGGGESEMVQCDECGELMLPGVRVSSHQTGNPVIVWSDKSYLRCSCNNLLIVQNEHPNLLLETCPRCHRVLMFGLPQEEHFYCLCPSCDQVVCYGPTPTNLQQTEPTLPYKIRCNSCKNVILLKRRENWWSEVGLGALILLVGLALFSYGAKIISSPTLFSVILITCATVVVFLGGYLLKNALPFIFWKEANHLSFEKDDVDDSLEYLSHKRGFQPSIKHASIGSSDDFL